MELDKRQILDFLREQGQQDQATQAERELPDHVDTEKNADLLRRLGVDQQELIRKFLGRGGIPSL